RAHFRKSVENHIKATGPISESAVMVDNSYGGLERPAAYHMRLRTLCKNIRSSIGIANQRFFFCLRERLSNTNSQHERCSSIEFRECGRRIVDSKRASRVRRKDCLRG